MAPRKEASRTRRKGGARRDRGERVGRATGEDAAGQQERPGVTMVDIDPWGAFFEKLWEQPQEEGGESANPPERGRKPTKGARTTGTKPGR